MAEPSVIRCPECGRANRVRPVTSGVPSCASCHERLPWLVDADAATFEPETQASVPVLVDFRATWCAPCRMVSPALERLARSRAGRLKVVKVDTDRSPGLAARYRVQGIPTIVLIRDGAEVDRRVGALPEAELSSWVDGHLQPAGG